MKKLLRLTLTLILLHTSSFILLHAQVGINNDNSEPDASAMLDVKSTDKGMLVPRMDSTARNVIVNPADGLLVYDSTTTSFWYYDEMQWNEIRSSNKTIIVEDLVCTGDTNDSLIVKSRLMLGGFPEHIAVANNFAYVLDAAASDLKVIDVNNPNAPSISGSIGLGNDPQFISVVGDFVYTVDANSGLLSIIDVSDPNNLNITGTLGVGIDPNGGVAFGNYAYIIDERINSLLIIDVSDAANPIQISSIEVGKDPKDIATDGSYVYIAKESDDSLLAIDVRIPSMPTVSDNLSIEETRFPSMAIDGSYVYIVGRDKARENGLLTIYDISDPNNLTSLGSIGIDEGSSSIAVENGFAYVTDAASDDLKVINVSDPNNPSLVNQIVEFQDPRDVAVSNGIAYVVDAAADDITVVAAFCNNIVRINGDLEVTGSFPDTDDQTLSFDGTNISIADGNSIDISSIDTDTDNQIIDKLNLNGTTLEISLEDDGQVDQTVDLSSIDTDTDNQTIDKLNLNGTTLEISLEDDGQVDQTLDLSSLDTDTDNQTIDKLNLNGTTLEISLEDDGEVDQTVDLSSIDTDTDNQTIDKLNLNGTTLEISLEDDGEVDQTVDLSSIDTDTDNQTIDKLNLNGTTLEISLEDDGEVDQTVDLSSIDTDTDNQTIDKLNLNGTTLEISLEDDGEVDQTVDLSSIDTDTDDQKIDVLNLNGTTLEISLTDDAEPTQTLDLSSLEVPVGTIQMWPTSTPPTGWLICNGTVFNSGIYPELFNVLGGDVLPNFNGRFPLGAGNSGTQGAVNHTLGTDGGQEDVTLDIKQIPAHTHDVTVTYREGTESGSSSNDYSDLGGASNDSPSSSYTSASAGGMNGTTLAHENMPPFYTINFIIKAE